MKNALRIATRKSPLALWQARYVSRLLAEAHPQLPTELVPLQTRGDKILDRSLAKVGGKGLFIKELEIALLEERADIAVHSMKDMPVGITSGLCISTLLPRANPFDAFVSSQHANVAALPEGARVGTSSLRRASQLLGLRPDLQFVPLRGNVETRLAKLDSGECEATMLAVAGLERLGLDERITAQLTPEQCLPAIGQGVIGIECRAEDARVRDFLEALHCSETEIAIRAERALGAGLGGSCQSPIAGYACPDGAQWILRARVLAPDGSQCVAGERRFEPREASSAGQSLADELMDGGARQILNDIAAAS